MKALLQTVLLVSAALGSAWAQQTPRQTIEAYYQAITDRDYSAYRALYPNDYDLKMDAARFARDFQFVAQMRVHRWLGVQQQGELAHVLVTVEVRDRDEQTSDYGFATHDLRRVDGRWLLINAEQLPAEQREVLFGLWRQQREQMRSDPELQAHQRWVAEQRRQARERRQQRQPQVVPAD